MLEEVFCFQTIPTESLLRNKHTNSLLVQKIFGSIEEVVIAYENRVVGLHAKINLKHKGTWIKDTTVGRAIFNSILPTEMDFVDALIDKKLLTSIVNQCYLVVGNYKTVIFLDALKDLGFKMATSSGLSISVSDVLIPQEKHSILSTAFEKVGDIKGKFDRHVLTDIKNIEEGELRRGETSEYVERPLINPFTRREEEKVVGKVTYKNSRAGETAGLAGIIKEIEKGTE